MRESKDVYEINNKELKQNNFPKLLSLLVRRSKITQKIKYYFKETLL